MLRNLKTVIGLAVLLAVEQASAFSLWGPAEAWQTADLSYGNRFWYGGGFPEFGGTKNFGEGSRINTPIITYGFDFTFLSYFGTEGVKAVDAAIATMNALPAASAASPGLTEFIAQGAEQVNYTAQALAMFDIKSAVIHILVEHMGLIGATHIFDLRTRTSVTPPCYFNYDVVIRNWDPITYSPSTYVNGTRYGYTIIEGCPIVQIADAFEVRRDVTALPYSSAAVATLTDFEIGGYFTGLSRDDFGGLRYLYNKNSAPVNEALPVNAYASPTGASPYQPPPTNAGALGFVGLVQGVDKIRFVKVAFDSAVGATFQTNVVQYYLTVVTNGFASRMLVTRTNGVPDIIFGASDLGPGFTYSETFTFINTGLVLPSGGGTAPSVFAPTFNILLNKVGASYINDDVSFFDDLNPISFPTFQWGSYDGSSKPPVVFPKGTSIAALAELVTSTTPFPAGTYNPPPSATNAVATGTGGGIITIGP